ncbi:NADH-quinone oxidoreductase subunit M [soil metagenome]
MISLLILILPLLGALTVAFAKNRQTARGVALFSTIFTFVLALFLPGDGGISLLWIPGFDTYFDLDPTGAASVLIPVAALVMIPTVLYAGATLTERVGPFLGLLLGMQAGLNGLFLAKDLVVFYLFWEATLIPSVLMLGIWGGPERRRAAVKYLLYAVTGSFLMLVAILAIKPLSCAVSYRISDLLLVTPNLPLSTQVWLFVGFTLAFAVKLPLWPLHSWLPDFHEQNHPSGVADVAGTLYKVGGFGFFAWAMPLLPDAAIVVAPILLALAAFTALYAATIATTQTNLKRLLAYASLSHMGIVGVGIFGLHIAGLNGAVFLLAAQMLSTGGMFLISGMLFERRNTFDLNAYGGLAKTAPALAALSLFVLFTSIGVPGLANFPGEFMSLMGTFQMGGTWTTVWTVLATTSVIAAGVYGGNLDQRLYQGQEGEVVPDLRSLEAVVLIPIVAGILWLGLNPAPQLRRIEVQSRVAAISLENASESPDVLARGDR